MFVTNLELVRRAQAGEIGALALLLERHRARIHAVCAAHLGTGSDTGDVVHDVFLVAVQHISRLVDPEAAGAWLVGIARNLCLRRRRERRMESLDVLHSAEEAALEPDAERLLHDRALGDWVWSALAGLSEPLRMVVVLRYFTGASSYDSMAAVLGIPVGTVRSRLNEARRKLGSLLREQASGAHDDHAALVRRRYAFFDEVFSEYNRGLGCTQLARALTPDAVVYPGASARPIRGPRAIARDIETTDIRAGVQLSILEVIAGHGITVLEGSFTNPDNDPKHCPPLTTQVYFHEGDFIRALRLHYGAA